MPDWSKEIRELVGGLNLSPAREAEVSEELAQHLADRYEEALARGASEEEACRVAASELESPQLAVSLSRVLPPERPAPTSGQDSPGSFAASVWRDLAHGLRLLRLDPGFAIAAVLSLALGIGANTAIFQLLDTVILRPLPVKEPGRLAKVKIVGNSHGRSGNFSANHPDITSFIWEGLEKEQAGFSRIGAWSSERLNLAPGGEARYVDVLWVSGGFFGALGVEPRAGRLLSADDDRKGCGSPGLVVSDGFWRREVGGRGSAVGSSVAGEGHPFRILGGRPRGVFGRGGRR